MCLLNFSTMDPCEEFVKQFKQIDCTTIGDRKKELNRLLIDLKKINLSKEDLRRLEQLITPTSKLEETLKLTVFTQLKYTDYLFTIFESENLYLIGKLVKEKWFFKNAFHHIKGEELVKLLAKVSPVTRAKLITKLAGNLEDEVLAEDYFVSVLNKYGLCYANKLLSSCRVEFIKSVLEKYEVKFSDRQLLNIVKKHRAFAEFYFEKFCVPQHYQLKVANYLLVLHYIASVDFPLFLSIFEKFELEMKLNVKLTKKVYELKKDDVITRPENYLKFMDYDKLSKLLGDDFNKFYANSFPKAIKEFAETIGEPGKKYETCSRTYKLIQHFPRHEKYEMLTKTFLQVYKVDIFKYTSFITEYFMEFMPKEVRIKWAKQLLKEDKWICYLEIQDSIPMLKEKINLIADRTKRSTYLNYLVETCRIHRDINALLEVLKYFVDKHRNEDVSNIASFLSKIRSSFSLNTFNIQHWTEIEKLFKLLKLKEHFFYEMPDFRQYFYCYLYESNVAYDDTITKLYKEMVDVHYSFNTFQLGVKYQKAFILKFGEIILKEFNGEKLFKACSRFMADVRNWNSSYPKDQIDVLKYPELIRIMMDQDNKKHRDYLFASFILVAIASNSRTPERDIIIHEFFENFKEYFSWEGNKSPIIKFLQNEPKLILKYAEKIVANSEDCCLKQFNERLKFYSHLQLPQKFKQLYLSKLDDEKYTKTSILSLSYLMSTREYIDTMKQYHIRDTKINFDDESDIFKHQNYFITALKNVDHFSTTLPLLIQFCVGDYLDATLGTLSRAVDNIPVGITEEWVKELFKKSVSVRKHAIYLTVRTKDLQSILETFKLVGQRETNPSLLKFLFKRTFKYFCQNQSQVCWELLKINAQVIKKEDDEAYAHFFEIQSIPYKYVARFIEFAWASVEQSTSETVRAQRFSLLNHINEENIEMFPDVFCRRILESFLFNHENRHIVLQFCCTYLLASGGHDNLEFVCDLLRKYVKAKWASEETGTHRETVSHFLNEICNSFRKKDNAELLKKFASQWYAIVDNLETYQEYLTLQFTILYMTTEKEYKIRNFAQKVYDLYSENIQKYGHMIIDTFSETLRDLIIQFVCETDIPEEENLFVFYVGLSNVNKSPETFALILNLLPQQYSLTQDIALQHKMLLLEISHCNEPWIKIIYNKYLKNLTHVSY